MSNTTTSKLPILSKEHLTVEQKTAIRRLYEFDETLLIAKMGFGKAIVGLTALQALLQAGVIKRALVLAPLKVATLTWGTEPERWSHITVPVALACGTPAARNAAINGDSPIIVSNFENIKWLAANHRDRFDAVLIDELGKLKQPGGTWVSTLRRWLPKMKWRGGMTGTPVAQAGYDIFAQALLIDNGKALGTNHDRFMRRYFYPTDFNEYNWAPKPDGIERIATQLRGLVYVCDDASYQADLPPLETRIEYVTMPEDAREIYRVLEADSCWGPVEASNAAVLTGKLQQVAAGGLYAGEDRDLVWLGDFKRAAANQVIGGLTEPVLVVYHYAFELGWLREDYPDAPIIGGGHKITRAVIDRWNRGEIPVMLLHWRSGSHGLNLQYGSRTVLCLSPLWSADGWQQVIARVRRRGQTRTCHRIVLVTSDSVEDKMATKLIERAENEKRFMDAIG